MDLLDEIMTPKHATIKYKKDKKRTVIDNPILFSKGFKIDYTFVLDKMPENHK
jgi:hypothetical protein